METTSVNPPGPGLKLRIFSTFASCPCEGSCSFDDKEYGDKEGEGGAGGDGEGEGVGEFWV